jgi:hypothetical protein
VYATLGLLQSIGVGFAAIVVVIVAIVVVSAPPLALIHRSAWKVNSPKFGFTAF